MSTWILLRGLTREKRHWGDFPQLLMQELPEARVIPLELPGNGNLNHVASPIQVAEMADHCRGTLARIGVAPPYHLLAMSLGGMVAAAWSEAHPEEIKACVLINTSFGSFSPLQHRLRPSAWPKLLEMAMNPSAEGREQLIFELTTGMAQDRARVVGEWAAIRRSRPVSAWNALRQMVAAARFRAPRVAPVPTLVLVGAGDRLVDPRCSEEIALRWTCTMAIHPEAGHDLPLEAGPWVAGEIRKWLNPSKSSE